MRRTRRERFCMIFFSRLPGQLCSCRANGAEKQRFLPAPRFLTMSGGFKLNVDIEITLHACGKRFVVCQDSFLFPAVSPTTSLGHPDATLEKSSIAKPLKRTFYYDLPEVTTLHQRERFSLWREKPGSPSPRPCSRCAILVLDGPITRSTRTRSENFQGFTNLWRAERLYYSHRVLYKSRADQITHSKTAMSSAENTIMLRTAMCINLIASHIAAMKA